jgi:hypothetical protein
MTPTCSFVQLKRLFKTKAETDNVAVCRGPPLPVKCKPERLLVADIPEGGSLSQAQTKNKVITHDRHEVYPSTSPEEICLSAAIPTEKPLSNSEKT